MGGFLISKALDLDNPKASFNQRFYGDFKGISSEADNDLAKGLVSKGQSMIHQSFPPQGTPQPSHLGSQSDTPSQDQP